MAKKIGIILTLLLIIVIFSVGCCGSSTTVDSTGSTSSSTSVSTSTSDLQLVGSSSVETGDYGTKYIVGRIQNTGKKTYSYVQVTINLYDDSGAQVGSTLDNINNLEPGGIWKFKAMWLEDDATKYKIKEITGW